MRNELSTKMAQHGLYISLNELIGFMESTGKISGLSVNELVDYFIHHKQSRNRVINMNDFIDYFISHGTYREKRQLLNLIKKFRKNGR